MKKAPSKIKSCHIGISVLIGKLEVFKSYENSKVKSMARVESIGSDMV